MRAIQLVSFVVLAATACAAGPALEDLIAFRPSKAAPLSGNQPEEFVFARAGSSYEAFWSGTDFHLRLEKCDFSGVMCIKGAPFDLYVKGTDKGTSWAHAGYAFTVMGVEALLVCGRSVQAIKIRREDAKDHSVADFFITKAGDLVAYEFQGDDSDGLLVLSRVAGDSHWLVPSISCGSRP